MNKSLKAAAVRQRKANNQKIEEAFTLLLEMHETSNRGEAQLLEGTITIMLQEVYEKRLNCLRPLEDVLFKMQKVVKAYNEQNYGEPK